MLTTTQKKVTNYHRLARDQRLLAWLTMAFLGAHAVVLFADMLPQPVGGVAISATAVIWVSGYLACAVVVGVITNQLQMKPGILMLVAVLAFVPFVSLLPIIAVQARLNRFWKSLGLRPTIFGVDPALAEGLQYGTRCAACGYDLKGNESGVCPECARKVELTSA